MAAIYLHEDEFGQIELLPLSLWQHCVDQMKEIDDFAKTHETEFGWSEIYLREEPPKSLSDFSISLNVFKDCAEKTLVPYSKVTTGYNSYRETCDNTFAWGIPDKSFTIFCYVPPENNITKISLDFGCLNERTLQSALTTFANLPHSQDLILADWNRNQLSRIADGQKLREYLTKHIC
jgi:hypothetical protein